ncbi:hypothetical protein, partial [Schaedlerella arabinosiphila]|uniref:hypothetical protein n=1 Tax=Schaedlerella arabinosiphila TaxID=2044587 RepID=UPI0025583A57
PPHPTIATLNLLIVLFSFCFYCSAFADSIISCFRKGNIPSIVLFLYDILAMSCPHTKAG